MEGWCSDHHRKSVILLLWYNASGTLDDFVWKHVLAAVKEIQRQEHMGYRSDKALLQGYSEAPHNRRRVSRPPKFTFWKVVWS